MKYPAFLFISFFYLNLSAQTDTLEWLLQQANAPTFDWHKLAGKTPKKNLLKFIKHLKYGDYAESDSEYDPKEDGKWETYILQYFEYCDLDQDGNEDIVNCGWKSAYHWTQIAFGLGHDKYTAWLHMPGHIQYFNKTAAETIIATYGEGCCAYSPDVMALVSFPKKDPQVRFKYRAFLEGIPFIKDSFPIVYKRSFKTGKAISVSSSLPDPEDAEEEEWCDLGCYKPGAKGIAIREADNNGRLWYLALMSPGAGLRILPQTFPQYSAIWSRCYYAAGWVPAGALDFD